MNEINFYNALSSDLNALLNQTKNIVSNEEFVYVNQKVSRIQTKCLETWKGEFDQVYKLEFSFTIDKTESLFVWFSSLYKVI